MGKKKSATEAGELLKGRLDRLVAMGDVDRTLRALRSLEAMLTEKAARARRGRAVGKAA